MRWIMRCIAKETRTPNDNIVVTIKHSKMKKEVLEALEFFHGAGMIENLWGDERHYTEILIKYAAKNCKVELV